VDSTTYTEFDDAKTVRNRLNEAARAEAARPVPAPQFIVQHTAEDGHWQVGGVDPRYNGRSVDGHD
jgi:hypothetical protein